jgi:hypothetical protein
MQLTFVTVLAILARIALSTDANNVSDFDVLVDLVSDSDNLSDDLVSYDLRVHLCHVSPSTTGLLDVSGSSL